jgi:hypothetical protein
MIPSSFQRSALQNNNSNANRVPDDRYTDQKTRCPTGPADYFIERVIGKSNIVQANIKSEP